MIVKLSNGIEVGYYRLSENFRVSTGLTNLGWDISFHNDLEEDPVVSVDFEIPGADFDGSDDKLEEAYEDKLNREFDLILFRAIEAYFHNDANVIDLDLLVELMQGWMNANPPKVIKGKSWVRDYDIEDFLNLPSK